MSFIDDSAAWLEGAGGTLIGGAEDLFSQDNAYAPDVKPYMYENTQQAESERYGAVASYLDEAEAGARATRNAATGAGDKLTNVVSTNASGLTATGRNAMEAQRGYAQALNTAGRGALGQASEGFSYSTPQYNGMMQNVANTASSTGSLPGAVANINTNLGMDYSGVAGAGDVAMGTVGSAGQNQGTSSLLGYEPISYASKQAQGALAGFSPETQNMDALGRLRVGNQGLQELSRAQFGNLGAGGMTSQSFGSMGSLANRLVAGKEPSAAQAQMDAALDKNVAAQMALAQSGRGAYSGSGIARAQATAASLGQETAAQQATLRAQERAQQLQLASGLYEAQGGLGTAADQVTLASRGQLLEQLSTMSEQELARAGLTLEQLSTMSDQELQRAGLQLDAMGKAAAAAATNDQLGLQGRMAGSEAYARDMQNLVSATNANTAAQQAEIEARLAGAQTETERMAILAQYSGQADQLELQRQQALAQMYEGMGTQELAAYQAQNQVNQGWYDRGLAGLGAASDATATGYEQFLGAGMAGLDATTQAQMGAANLEAQGAYQSGAMLVDAYGNVVGNVSDWYGDEAARRAAIYGTSINAEAAVSAANAQLDAARDNSVIGMASGLIGALGYL